MNSSSINIIGGCQQLYNQVQTVEQQVQEEEITPVACEQLFEALEGISLSIKSLQASAQNIDEFAQANLSKLSDLEEKIVFLYGDIYTRLVDREVTLIKKEAQELAVSMGRGQPANVAAKVDSLKEHINTLCQSNALSRKNLIVIHTIQKFIDVADALFNGTLVSPALSQLGLLLSEQLMESEARSNLELDPMSAEILLELCEIIDLFTDNQFMAARSKIRNLPLDVQRRFDHHLKTLGDQEPGMESLNCIQALQATSQEIMMGEESPDNTSFIHRSGKESLGVEHAWLLA
jgi:hypothetical protein